MGKKRQVLIAGAAAAALLVSIGLYVALRPSAPAGTPSGAETGVAAAGGFTFFDIDADTPLTDALRRDLVSRLGSDAIAYRMPFSLEMNERGFLKTHFPELHRLDRQLVGPFGERREHNTVTLTYRHAGGMQVPFEYVELVFSNYDRRPLLFVIRPEAAGPAMLDALKRKYGPPGVVSWQEGAAETFWWEKASDLLLATVAPDRFGKPRYRFRIVFSRNLRGMLQREKEEADQREQRRRKAGERAF